MHEEHLSVACQLVLDSVPDDFGRELTQLCINGIPVWRRSGDDAHVACAHHGELQSARDRRRRKGKGIDICLHLLQLLLGRHPELLLLINDKQSEVFKLNIFPYNPMSTNKNIDIAGLHLLQCLLLFLGSLEAVHIVNGDGETFKSVDEGVEMLKGEHCCRDEHRHLFGVAHRLERRTYGYLGLPEPHIAAHEAVHRIRLLHVAFHIDGGLQLVGGVLIHERRLKLHLKIGVGHKLEPLRVLPFRIKLYQLPRYILHLALCLRLQLVPCV